MMRNMLRSLAPVVLAAYCFSFAIPAFGQESNYLVSAPSSVARGESFDLTITPINTTLNLNDITVALPPGISATRYPVTPLPDGSFVYRLLTGPYTGSFNINISIARAGGVPVTIVRNVSVQPTFFDTWGPLIVLGTLVLVVALSSGMHSRY